MPLATLLQSLEASLLGESVRSLGGWGYALINLMHILSIAILFGSIVILDMRLMGWRPQLSLQSVTALTIPIAAVGFAGAVASGICMLSANASDYIGNPFFIIKFSALFFALANAGIARQLSSWKKAGGNDPIQTEWLASVGLVSLLCWLIVIASGRLIAYW